MAETKVTTEMVETDRHVWRECLGCGAILEEKVFSKVVKEFEEIQIHENVLKEMREELAKTKKNEVKAALTKQIKEATRKYKVGDEYQWFGYGTGGQHSCPITR